jgi:HD-like signal output (HDOD) protein
MPETLLQMELSAHQHSIDLQRITQIVLSDPGATIQIMGMAGQESSIGEERLTRMEDFISALGVQACIEGVSCRIANRSLNRPAIQQAWSHSKQIAERCRCIAEEPTAQAVSPNEAFLAGLLHEIGSFPILFEWESALGLSCNPEIAGLELAKAWRLPQCVCEYFSEPWHPSRTTPWSGIVQRAHKL